MNKRIYEINLDWEDLGIDSYNFYFLLGKRPNSEWVEDWFVKYHAPIGLIRGISNIEISESKLIRVNETRFHLKEYDVKIYDRNKRKWEYEVTITHRGKYNSEEVEPIKRFLGGRLYTSIDDQIHARENWFSWLEQKVAKMVINDN